MGGLFSLLGGPNKITLTKEPSKFSDANGATITNLHFFTGSLLCDCDSAVFAFLLTNTCKSGLVCSRINALCQINFSSCLSNLSLPGAHYPMEQQSREQEEMAESNAEGAAVQENTVTEVDISGSLIGLKRKSIDEIYELYGEHARVLGFDLHRGTSRISDDGVLIEKYFRCSCQGSMKSKISQSGGSLMASKNNKRKNCPSTRTGCNAFLRVRLNDENLFEVINHVQVHNHPFTKAEWSHLHHSERTISSDKATESMVSSEMRRNDFYRYLAHEAGGDQDVGHSKKDNLNFVNQLKLKERECGDLQTLVELLYQQQSEEEDFFFRFKIDDMATLSSIFWRDSMMKEDYEIFGDVVIFDTTYRTNKYSRICVPIVGINNHWKNVMFGCAFLSNEKTESFEWLFEIFKKAMGGKCPDTIFTDQDETIAGAVEKTFPGTKHRLSRWHLYQNTISKLGQLENKSFKEAFRKCLSGCVDEHEFESCWSTMVSMCNLEDQPWFQRLYDVKDKWCTAVSKDFFSPGILSSQRSESTNNAKTTISLTEFYGIFKNLVNNWRMKEIGDEFQSSKSISSSTLPLTGMLKHASELYTLTVFEDFQAEFIESISTICNLVDKEEIITTYAVSSYDGDEGVKHVMFEPAKNIISCSCRKFEECGMLCWHSLRVLFHHNCIKIPEIYILKRWTRIAKSNVWDNLNSTVQTPTSCIPWRHKISRKYYNLMLECQGNEEAKRIVEEGYERVVLAISSLKNLSVQNVPSSAYTCCSVTMGRRRRIN